MESHGFAAINTVAPRVATQNVQFVQHGTIEEQRVLLAEIEPLALAGEFDGQRYALLYDRVAETEGRPQRFGSQDACIDGHRTLHTLENPDRVDEWRAQMGMEPLADYRARLIEMYGAAC